MTNRAHLAVRFGSAFLGLVLWAAGANLFAADTAKVECTSCHDQGQKLAKSAHADLACEMCHDSHDKYPHPANVPKPQCTTCHTDQAADYAGGVHGQARKHGNDN